MYPQFIVTYVLLGVAIALLAAVIVLQIVILKKAGTGMSGGRRNGVGNEIPTISFCPKCGSRYDSRLPACPKCSTEGK